MGLQASSAWATPPHLPGISRLAYLRELRRTDRVDRRAPHHRSALRSASTRLRLGASADLGAPARRCAGYRNNGGSTMWKRIMPMLGVVAGLLILGGCATAPSSQEGRVALTRDVGT